MGKAVAVGAQRAHHKSDRATFLRLHRPFRADRARHAAITRTVAGLGHRLENDDDLAGHVGFGIEKFLIRIEHHRLGFDFTGCRAAERHTDQWLGKFTGNSDGFRAATRPDMQREGFDMDVLEA